MKIQQIYTNCMSHAAYYLYSNNQCAIFDPLRDTQIYMDLAKEDKAEVKYVFETHFHADFVSGHLDLQKKCNAEIVFGPTANPGYQAIIAKDDQVFHVGDVKVKVLHTPGHTMESVTYLIIDPDDKPYCIITGDTLFIGDVGRPDLVQLVNSELTSEILAGHLFDSLRQKIMPLPDDLIVYPNHGAGSACGKNLSKETFDTLGNQKKTNYALDMQLSREGFISVLLNGLSKAPGYFPSNVLLNIKGYDPLADIITKANRKLGLKELLDLQKEHNAIILDTRSARDFSRGFLKGSIQVGLEGSFALWVGDLINGIQTPILLVCDKDTNVEVITRLSRVGYDNVLGYLEGPLDNYQLDLNSLEELKQICPTKFQSTTWPSDTIVLDVRNKSEFDKGHLDHSINIALNQLEEQLHYLSKDKDILVYCQGGYRSTIACSILKRYGYSRVIDIKGGYQKLSQKDAISCCSAIGCSK